MAYDADKGGSIAAGRKGENAWNARLSEALHKRGLMSADFERLFDTLKGTRKPDVAFSTSRGISIVSGKLSESKEADAIATAQEYAQTIGKITALAEAFSLTYPAGREQKFHLRVLANDLHGSLSWTFDSLDVVADKIVHVVQQQWDKARLGIESSVTAAIRVLRSGVNELALTMSRDATKAFAPILGGSDFYESVLGYGERKKQAKSERLLKSAGAYLLSNQILFYEVLASQIHDYPHIAPNDFDKPQVLKPKYFDRVLLKDYRPIFDFDISNLIQTRDAAQACKKIMLSIHSLFPGKIEHDIVGKIFHNIIPLDLRKLVAAYFTNAAAGDLLARLAIEKSEDTVADLACGSGTLLMSAYKRKARLYGGRITAREHRLYVEKHLLGIDIMPFSAHLAAGNLALLAPLYETNNIQIAIDDSTRHGPGDVIPPVRKVLKEQFKTRRLTEFLTEDNHKVTITESEKVRSGTVSLNDKEPQPIKLGSVDIIIMNPPFTSCDHLPSEYKAELRTRFSVNAAYQRCLTGKLSFQAYFILLADKFLKAKGTMACVLPLTTFHGKAFEHLTEFVVRNYTIRYIVVGLGRSAFSENTFLTEILFVGKKSVPDSNNHFVLVGTKKTPTEWSDGDVEDIARTAKESLTNQKSTENALCIVKVHSQTDLLQSKVGLAGMVVELDHEFVNVAGRVNSIYDRSGLITSFDDLEKNLKCELFAWELRIKGGKYYGFSALSISRSEDRVEKKNDVLIMKEELPNHLSVLDRFTDQVFQIPKQYVVPQVRRLSNLQHISIEEEYDFIVKQNFKGLKQVLESIYDVDKVPILERRLIEDWKAKVEHGLSNICIARRIDLSSPGTNLLAVFSPKPAFLSANSWGVRSISEENAKIMALWVNSSFFLLELLAKRAPTRASFGQIDERYLERLAIVALDRLNEEQRGALLKVFDNVSKIDFPSILDQFQSGFEGRKQIDYCFLDLMGVKDRSKQDVLSGKLYGVLWSRLNAMKETMKQD